MSDITGHTTRQRDVTGCSNLSNEYYANELMMLQDTATNINFILLQHLFSPLGMFADRAMCSVCINLRNSGDDPTTSYRNLVSFGTVTLEIMRLICVAELGEYWPIHLGFSH